MYLVIMLSGYLARHYSCPHIPEATLSPIVSCMRVHEIDFAIDIMRAITNSCVPCILYNNTQNLHYDWWLSELTVVLCYVYLLSRLNELGCVYLRKEAESIQFKHVRIHIYIFINMVYVIYKGLLGTMLYPHTHTRI